MNAAKIQDSITILRAAGCNESADLLAEQTDDTWRAIAVISSHATIERASNARGLAAIRRVADLLGVKVPGVPTGKDAPS